MRTATAAIAFIKSELSMKELKRKEKTEKGEFFQILFFSLLWYFFYLGVIQITILV